MFAFVTLVTSDFYLPGALTLAAALKDVHSSSSSPIPFQTVCLTTPETVDVTSIKLLRRAFDTVVGVEIISQHDKYGLNLLGMCVPHPCFNILARCIVINFLWCLAPRTLFTHLNAFHTGLVLTLPLPRSPRSRYRVDKAPHLPPHPISQTHLLGCRCFTCATSFSSLSSRTRILRRT